MNETKTTEKNHGMKGVIFDVGNTLLRVPSYDVDGWLVGLARKSQRHMGREEGIVKAEIKAEIEQINNVLIPDLERGKLTVPAFEKTVAEMFGINVYQVGWSTFFRSTIERNDEVINLAKMLHKDGIVTAYLSNLDAVQNEIVYEMVDGKVNFSYDIPSYKIGVRKQQPEAYVESAKLMGLKPNEVLLVDDSAKYVALANSVGIETITFNGDAQELEKQLALKVAKKEREE